MMQQSDRGGRTAAPGDDAATDAAERERAPGGRGREDARGATASPDARGRGDRSGDPVTGRAMPFAMVITDPHLPDNPIVYVNKAFERITGYSAVATIGRNCRFLQGPDTDPAAVAKLAEGIERREDVSVDLLNYRADGSSFMNRLLIAPLFGSDGKITSMLGIQREIPVDAARDVDDANADGGSTAPDGRESDGTREAARKVRVAIGKNARRTGRDPLAVLRERVEDHIHTVVDLVRFDEIDPDALPEAAPRLLGRRIEGLQLLYEELDQGGVGSLAEEDVALGAYLSRVCATLTHLEGRHSIRVNVDCDEVTMPVTAAARLGLLTTELLLNAMRHAFPDRRDGLVNVEFKVLTGGRVRLVVKDDGVGLTGDVDWPYATESGAREAEEKRERRTGERVGARLVRQMVDALDAEIDVISGSFGTSVQIGLDLGHEPG